MTKKETPKVALRGGFSDRMGIKPVNTETQVSDLDERTRVALVNLFAAIFDCVYEQDYGEARNILFSSLLSDVYLQKIRYGTRYDENKIFEQYINKTILEDDYDSVLTVIEYLAKPMYDYAVQHYQKISKRKTIRPIAKK